MSKDDTVSVLNLSAQNIGAGAVEALGSALRASLSITSVDFSLNSELGDEGVEFLVPALRTDGTGISTIRVLSLMRCGIGEAGKRNHPCLLKQQSSRYANHTVRHQAD